MLRKLHHVFGKLLCLLGAHKMVDNQVEYGGSGADGIMVHQKKCARTGCKWQTPISYNSN